MDIRCERCATEYELDESQVPDSGLPLKCATCGHVFKVFKPAPPTVTLRLTRNGQANLLPCPDEQTLEQWIRETRIIAADEISFDGATWERLGDIPEVAGLFPPPVPAMVPAPVTLPSLDLGEKTPSLHGVPLGSTLPSLALPTETVPALPSLALPTGGASKLPSLSLPADATVPELPKLSLPSLSLPNDATTPSIPKLSLPADATKLDSKPVVDPAKAAGETNLSLGKIGRAVEGAAPVRSQSPVGPVIPSAQPVSAPVAAPKETAPVATSKPQEKKGDKKSDKQTEQKKVEAKKEEPKKEEPKKDAPKAPAKPVDTSETDPEIVAFKKQGRGGRVAAYVLGGAAVLGGAGYFGWQHLNSGVPESAKAAYAKGRELYLTDTRAKFKDAEAAFKEALKLSAKTPYADAYAGLAELHAAWGEPLFVKGSVLLSQLEAKQEAAKKDPENKVLAKEVAELGTLANDVNKEASEHLRASTDFAKKALEIDRANVAARRALLDYYRVTNVEASAKNEASKLKELNANDPETAAHLAALAKLDATQLETAQAALTASVQANPKFVRAYTWLADLQHRAQKEADALASWNAALKAAPGHEEATEALATLKPAEVADAKPAEVKPAEKPAQKVAEQKPVEKPAEAKPVQKPAEKPAEVKTAEAKPAEKVPPAPAAAVDVDKTIAQADALFEKGKIAKALELYLKAAEARPTSAEAHFGVGLAQSELKQTDAAIVSFKKTLSISPRFGDAMISLAEAYKAKGANAEAAKYYRQYVETYPNGPYSKAANQNLAALK